MPFCFCCGQLWKDTQQAAQEEVEAAFTPNVAQQQHFPFLSNLGPAVFTMAKIRRWQELETASTFRLPSFMSYHTTIYYWTIWHTTDLFYLLGENMSTTQRQIFCDRSFSLSITNKISTLLQRLSTVLQSVPLAAVLSWLVFLPGLISTHILVLVALYKWGASCCHVYVVINQLGLFARSVQSTNRLSVRLCVRSPYVTLTGVPLGGARGVRTDMRQQMTPVNQEFYDTCSFKIHNTHAAIWLPHRKLSRQKTSVALQNNLLMGKKFIAFVSVLAMNLIIQRTRCPLLTRSLVPGYLIRRLTDYFVLIALSNGGKQYGSFSAWPEDLPAGGDAVGWMWSPESPSVQTSLRANLREESKRGFCQEPHSGRTQMRPCFTPEG